MIRLDSNDQGDLAVFALSRDDHHRAQVDVPRQVCLMVDEDHFRGSAVEMFVSRWVLVASMLTGLSCSEIEAEGVEVRRFTDSRWVPRPFPSGTKFVGVLD